MDSIIQSIHHPDLNIVYTEKTPDLPQNPLLQTNINAYPTVGVLSGGDDSPRLRMTGQSQTSTTSTTEDDKGDGVGEWISRVHLIRDNMRLSLRLLHVVYSALFTGFIQPFSQMLKKTKLESIPKFAYHLQHHPHMNPLLNLILDTEKRYKASTSEPMFYSMKMFHYWIESIMESLSIMHIEHDEAFLAGEFDLFGMVMPHDSVKELFSSNE